MSYKSSISSQNIEDILKKIDGAIALDPAILSLSSSSSSTTISNAVGGSSGFTDILNSLRGGGITFGIIKDDSNGKGFIQANMYAHPTENKLTVAWLDSLTPKEVVISLEGNTFSLSFGDTEIKATVPGYWVSDNKIGCDITGFVPKFLIDQYALSGGGYNRCEPSFGGAVTETCVNENSNGVTITRTYALSGLPSSTANIDIEGTFNYKIKVILPPRIIVLSESSYESSGEYVEDNNTIYMVYPDA